jgi:hypothetical protein
MTAQNAMEKEIVAKDRTADILKARNDELVMENRSYQDQNENNVATIQEVSRICSWGLQNLH